MKIEVRIFSGRPNPAWRLTEQECLEFIGMLETIRKSNVNAFPRGNLGYEGLLVVREQPDPGRFRQIWIKGNVVLLTKDIREVAYLDDNRKLERWLIASGKPHMDPRLWELIVSEAEKSSE